MNIFSKKLILIASNFLFFSAYAEEPLKVCSEAGFFPFEMKKSNGTWKGYDIELAQKFAQHIHRPIQIIDMKFDELIPALNKGEKCDFIASAMDISKDRQKALLFSNVTYKSAYAGIIRKNDQQKFKKFTDINNKNTKIASQVGTEADSYIHQEFSEAKKLQFDNNNDPINAVIKKKADIYIDDSVYLAIAEARNKNLLRILPLNILPHNKFGEMAFAFRKDNIKLRDEFNVFFKTFEENGDLKKLQDYYFENLGWTKDFQ